MKKYDRRNNKPATYFSLALRLALSPLLSVPPIINDDKKATVPW